MANEVAVVIELLGKDKGCPVRYTCANGVGIAKGTLMELTSPRTVIANTNANAPLVGIAAHEKVASDGATTISVYTNGIFDVLIGAGAQSAGKVQANSATENTVEAAAAADFLNSSTLGYLLEDTAGGVVSAIRVLK